MRDARPVHLCGRPVEGGRHVCALVRGRDEEYAIRAPYVKEGVERGDLVLQVVGDQTSTDHDARMAAAGIDAPAAERAGTLVTRTEDEVYLPRGYFDQDRMLQLVRDASAQARASGRPRVRTFGSMAWALKGAPGTEQMLEYETRVNELARGGDDVFVCSYDVNRFPATTIIDMMRTHPALIVGGVYYDNPYYVPPDRMLEELAHRGKAKRA